MSPMRVTELVAAGEVHPSPFLGPIEHQTTVRIDVDAMSTAEVDAKGYIKPGVLLTRAGRLVSSEDALFVDGTLAISATAEEFKTTTTVRALINGVYTTKAAEDNIAFTAAHVVTANKYGIILVQMDEDGTVTTKVPAATQAYDTAAAALAALPLADADNVALGYIAIAADSGNWTANTDDLTNGSDLTTATFVDASATTEELNANRGFGAVIEAVKVADGNTTALLAAAADIDIAVATHCLINRDILEDSLGRSLTTYELSNKSDGIVFTST